MKVKFKYLQVFFSIIICIFLLISFWNPLPAVHGQQIGVSASVLSIGDRSFYIDDLNPFSSERGNDFEPSPLYPKILQSVSAVSLHVFDASTRSRVWNILLIAVTAFCALISNYLLYNSGCFLASKRVGLIASALFLACPYTYFYILSGGITMYVFFGISLLSFLALRPHFYCQSGLKANNIFLLRRSAFFFACGAVVVSMLRPTTALYCVVVLSLFLASSVFGSPKSPASTAFKVDIWFALALVFCLHQLHLSSGYSYGALEAFQKEQGQFFGYPRDLLRSDISDYLAEGTWIASIKYFVLSFTWKILDFVSGMIDLRDTHGATSHSSLYPFFARLFAGMFYMAPVMFLAVMSCLVNRRLIISSGLIFLLLASFFAVSPSFIGVAMSRYLYMFLSPFLLSASILIDRLISLAGAEIEA